VRASTAQVAIAKLRKRARRVALKVLTTVSPTIRRRALVGPPQIWADKRRFQFEFLTSHGLRPEHRLLDIGCGALRGGIPLIGYLDAGNYAGIEARADVLEEGRKELARARLEPKRPLLIHASDPAQIQLAAAFDFVWAHSVLYHMPDDVLDAYLGLVSSCLRDGGQFYANVKLRRRDNRRQARAQTWQGFPVVARTRDCYESTAARHGLCVEEVGTLGSLGDPAGVGANEIMLRFTHAPAAPLHPRA